MTFLYPQTTVTQTTLYEADHVYKPIIEQKWYIAGELLLVLI